jgi:DNA-binding NarL/FixJ family response regulator
MKSVIVCCGSPVLSHGLRAIVSNDFLVTGLFERPEALVSAVPATRPDVILMETGPSFTFESLELLRQITRNTTVVLWVDTISPEFAAQCIAAGVRGVLAKSASVEAHLHCLSQVALGQLWFDQALTTSLLGTREIKLSKRERQMVGLVTQGLSNKEIAWALGVTPGTVKVYMSRLFHKANVNDRFELALMALKYIPGQAPARQPRRPNQPAVPIAFPGVIRIGNQLPC